MAHLTTAGPPPRSAGVRVQPGALRLAERCRPRSGRPRRRSRTGARRSRRGVVTGRPEHHERGHGHGVGDAEQRAHVVLAAHGHGGHDAGQSLGRGPPAAGSRRRGRWRRRRPGCSGAGRGRPRPAPRGRPGRAGGRARIERLGEARVRRRPPRRTRAASARAAASAARSVTGAQGTRPADAMARYSYQPARYRSRSAVRVAAVLDHDDAPALAVAAARGEAGRIEQAGQHVVGDGLGVELAHRAGAAQRVDEVEVHELPTVAAGG